MQSGVPRGHNTPVAARPFCRGKFPFPVLKMVQQMP